MTELTIIHLIDDSTPGGVMRLLHHIRTHALLMRGIKHEVREIRRGSLSAPQLKADLIVSHLAISWRGLPFLMQLRAMNAHIPLLHVEHSYTAGFVAHKVRSKLRFFTLLRTAYALFDKVAAVSEAQHAWISERGLVDMARLELLRSAVDVMPFLRLPAVTHAPKTIGAIGRLDEQKGFDVLIAAFRACPRHDLRLKIYGNGVEGPALQALAEDDARITFHSHIDNPVEAMAAVDVVAMPSRWEAYGLVGLEARAAGRALLVSGVDGLADHVASGAHRVNNTVDGWVDVLNGLDASVLLAAAIGRLRAMESADKSANAWASLIREMTAPRLTEKAA